MARGAGQKKICTAKCLYRFKTLIIPMSFAITSVEWGTRDSRKCFKRRKAASHGNTVATEPRVRTFVRGIENCGSISLLRIRT